MSEVIKIESAELQVVEHQGQRVVTLAMVDEVHRKANGTARKRFNDHRDRFVEGEDFFVRNPDEAKALGITAPNGLILLSESGYLMLVKSFMDDLAWQVQRALVRTYFRARANTPAPPPVPSEFSELRKVVSEQGKAILSLEAMFATLMTVITTQMDKTKSADGFVPRDLVARMKGSIRRLSRAKYPSDAKEQRRELYRLQNSLRSDCGHNGRGATLDTIPSSALPVVWRRVSEWEAEAQRLTRRLELPAPKQRHLTLST